MIQHQIDHQPEAAHFLIARGFTQGEAGGQHDEPFMELKRTHCVNVFKALSAVAIGPPCT
jgi:hypothetical protein